MAKSREIRSRGTVERIGRNKWRIHVSAGYDDVRQKYTRFSRTVTGSKSDALDALDAFRQELKTGKVSAERPYAYTVGRYARAFHDERRGTLSPLSEKRERAMIDQIERYFGGWEIGELGPADIRQVYRSIREEGQLFDDGIFKLHRKLKQVMKQALLDELVVRNPCDAVKVSKPKPQERKSLSPEEAVRLFSIVTSGEPSAPPETRTASAATDRKSVV